MWNGVRNRQTSIRNGLLTRRSSVYLAVVFSGMFLWPSCTGCNESPLATLVSSSGNVERDFAESMHQWLPAKKGAKFHVNDSVRTLEKSNAELWLRDGSGLRMQQNSFIRFSRTPPGQNRVSLKIEEGVIIIDAVTDNLEINTQYGVAIIEKGTRIKLTRGANGVVLEVQIGKARFLTEDQESLLREGQRLQATMEKAVIIVDTDTTDTSASALQSAASESADILFDGEPPLSNSNASHPIRSGNDIKSTQLAPDILLSPNESAWIHTMSPPVNIAINPGWLCPGGGILKNGKKIHAFSAEQPVVFSAQKGRNKYSIHCATDAGGHRKESDASGVLHVIKDRGKVRLAQTPPLSTVLMDGRTYNVYYQSRLPNIQVKWPTAPRSSRFMLQINGESPQQMTLLAPQYSFTSGSLREGTYVFKFIDEKSGERSRRTTLKIKFDNVADKAILIAPAEGSFSEGASVAVRGIAMTGWHVNTPTGKVTMDNSGRFEGTVAHRVGYRAIWLRLSHPQRGVQYYVRRMNRR